MEVIAFVLWLVLYPLTVSVCRYLDTWSREVWGHKHPSEGVVAVAAWIGLSFYIWIAVLIWRVAGQ